MLVDDKTAECGTGALRSERAWAAPFTRADVGPGMIAMTSAAVVQRLTGGSTHWIFAGIVGEITRYHRYALFVGLF